MSKNYIVLTPIETTAVFFCSVVLVHITIERYDLFVLPLVQLYLLLFLLIWNGEVKGKGKEKREGRVGRWERRSISYQLLAPRCTK